MQDKKILVVGYFGYETNQLDGQTIRTRCIYSLLKNKSNWQIDYFDTQTVKKSKSSSLSLLSKIMQADIVFCIAAHRNLKYLFPAIFFMTMASKTKLNYVSIGGWLVEFLENKPIHAYMLRNIQGVYVQTENLFLNLSKKKYNNVHLLHNFRITDYPLLDIEKNNSGKIRLVFMARVNPMKGVNLLFDLAKKIEELGLDYVSIDIYGPVLESYEPEFFDKVNKSTINYAGIIQPNDIYDTLKNYDLMLFPTKYYTEGFPGTILDAYISGLPVIATNWLNAKDFIDDQKTGYIIDFDNESLFIDKVIKLIENPYYIFSLQENVKKKREDYSAEAAWNILESNLWN